ncbi:MAG: SDR family oxidoreductase [Bacteroidales bacterium]|nr:SDR family oxidoreductase [Bacteroidales bacterium]
MKTDYFKGKVIIVTGASSGIGLASAKLFGSLGARVVAAARSIDKLEALVPEIAPDPQNVLCVKADVSLEEDCRNLVEKTVEKWGGIDILVNNAGLSMRAMFRDLELGVIKRLMDVNFWGTVFCTKYALPYLLESKGSVVGVISIAGFAGLPARTGYSSSKYAIRGFLDTLRMEHLYDGLHVMIFAPGFTASNVRNVALTADGSQQGSTPRDEGKMMSAEKCAEYLAKGLARRKAQMVLTPIGKATVLLHNLFPRLLDRVELSYMAKEPDSPFRSK